MSDKVVRLLIRGRVQRVWFRGWMMREAAALGLRGWVQNLSDGAVEAVIAGPAGEVDVLIAACRQGPPAARVGGITVEPADDPGGDGFHALPTF